MAGGSGGLEAWRRSGRRRWRRGQPPAVWCFWAAGPRTACPCSVAIARSARPRTRATGGPGRACCCLCRAVTCSSTPRPRCGSSCSASGCGWSTRSPSRTRTPTTCSGSTTPGPFPGASADRSRSTVRKRPRRRSAASFTTPSRSGWPLAAGLSAQDPVRADRAGGAVRGPRPVDPADPARAWAVAACWASGSGDLAYCTDVCRIPETSWPLLEGLDTLILDALRLEPHPTHFSLSEALAVIERFRPRRTVLDPPVARVRPRSDRVDLAPPRGFGLRWADFGFLSGRSAGPPVDVASPWASCQESTANAPRPALVARLTGRVKGTC